MFTIRTERHILFVAVFFGEYVIVRSVHIFWVSRNRKNQEMKTLGFQIFLRNKNKKVNIVLDWIFCYNFLEIFRNFPSLKCFPHKSSIFLVLKQNPANMNSQRTGNFCQILVIMTFCCLPKLIAEFLTRK